MTETWRIERGGEIITIRTSASSIRAMDEALRIYAKALERLADR